MSDTTHNEYEIRNNIHEILTESLIEDFIDDDLFDYDNFYDYISDTVIENIFNRDYFNVEYCNVLHSWNKSYTLDFQTTINILRYLKEELVDNLDDEEFFCDMFDEGVDSEAKIINIYAYNYIRQFWSEIIEEKLTDKWSILLIYKNIGKYNSHKKKHNKLISLYEKLNNKNNQKKTIKKC